MNASPLARVLAGFSGVVLLVVGFELRTVGVVFDPIFWEAAYIAGGAGLIFLAFVPDVRDGLRASISVVVATALVARSFALIVVLVRFPDAGGSILVGALVWPLVAAYIVSMLAYWPQLDRVRPGGRRDRDT